MTVSEAADPSAPAFEDPPEPERYMVPTALADRDYGLRLYGWDGEAADSGDVLYRDAAIATVRPSADGGWFATLTADGVPRHVTTLVADPHQAALDGAIYYSVTTGISFNDPIPPAEPAPERGLTRPDVVRALLRNAASGFLDRIGRASTQAWPDDFQQHTEVNTLLDRLTDMQAFVVEGAGAQRMEADLAAAAQAANALGETLSNDPADQQRVHMGYQVAYLRYDLNRLQTYLQAAINTVRTERAAPLADHAAQTAVSESEQHGQEISPAPDAMSPDAEQSAPTPEPADVPEAATAPESATPQAPPTTPAAAAAEINPEPEPATEPEPEPRPAATAGSSSLPVPENQLISTTIPLPRDPTLQLHLTGTDTTGYDAGELRRGPLPLAELRANSVGSWYARLSDPSLPAYITTASAGPEEAADKAAIMRSGLTGEIYGQPPTAVHDTPQVTRGEILHAEMRNLAAHHREALTAARRTTPNMAALDQLYLDLDQMRRETQQTLTSRQMADQLYAAQTSGTHVLDAIDDKPDAEQLKQDLAFPVTSLLHDVQRLGDRLAATMEALQAEQQAQTDQQTQAAADQQPPPASHPGPQPVTADPVPALAEPSPVQRDDRTEEPAEAQPEEAAPEGASNQEAASSAEPQEPAAPAGKPSVPQTASAAEKQSEATADEPAPGPAAAADFVQAPQPVSAPDPTEPTSTPEAGLPLADPALPLLPDPGPRSSELTSGASDLFTNLAAIQQAWEAVTRPSDGAVHDLRAALEPELKALQRALDAPTLPKPDSWHRPTSPDTPPRVSTPEAGVGSTATEVTAALNAAQHHGPSLRDLPEWQEIQTVRGAFRNLWDAIKRETGTHFDKFRSDDGVQGWWKRASIRVCERIADLALRTADRLRGDAPESAEAMDRLHRAADTYTRPTAPPPTGRSDLPEQMRKLGDGLVAAGIKVNAARARSTTTRKPPAPRPNPAGQPAHLRRTSADQKRGPRHGR